MLQSVHGKYNNEPLANGPLASLATMMLANEFRMVNSDWLFYWDQ